MGLKIFIVALLFLTGCDGVPAFADEPCIFWTDDQGIPRVKNAEDCEKQDPQLVKYLNCYDKYIFPPEQRPKECR